MAMSFEEGLVVGRLMSGSGRLKRTVRDLEDDLVAVMAQRDALAQNLQDHQKAVAAWKDANASLRQQIADLQDALERERQDFQALLRHERFERMLEGAVIAGKTAVVKAAGEEMRACPAQHKMLERDELGVQKAVTIYNDAFDRELKGQGVSDPARYRTASA